MCTLIQEDFCCVVVLRSLEFHVKIWIKGDLTMNLMKFVNNLVSPEPFLPIVLYLRDTKPTFPYLLCCKVSNKWSTISVRCIVPELSSISSKGLKTSMLSLPTSMSTPGDDVGDFLANHSNTNKNSPIRYLA